MVKCTREQRLRAVRLYERYDRSAASVTDELGYPSRGMLAQWHRAWVEAVRDDGRSLDDGRGERYTPERKRAAVGHYLQHGRCLRRTLRALGYPSHEVLARWIDELEPDRRRLRRAPVDEPTRRRAVVRYACGEATSRRIGEELGMSADVVRNWKHTMLSHDDKERRMRDEDARRKPEPAQEDPTPSSGACRPIEDMRRERGELVAQLAALWAERLELGIEVEAIRYVRQLLGKERGADPGNPPTPGRPVWCCIWPACSPCGRGICGAGSGFLAARSITTADDSAGPGGASGWSNRSWTRSGKAGNATATGAYGRCCASGASACAPDASCGS